MQEQSIKMDDLPSLWARNAANQPQPGLTTRRSLAATASTMGSPFTNPQGLGSLASTVLPGMWRRASQPLPSYVLDEISPQAVAPVPVIPQPAMPEPKQTPSSAGKVRIPVKQKAASRPRPIKKSLVPAISTHRPGSRQMSSTLSTDLSDELALAAQSQPSQDSATWRTIRKLLVVSPMSICAILRPKHVIDFQVANIAAVHAATGKEC